ncbi:MAG: hypothetical protein F6K14_33505 [Symploca sp. SIO2C1]|nr:hypothetical protein [Symploca sp. SIO2C1]
MRSPIISAHTLQAHTYSIMNKNTTKSSAIADLEGWGSRSCNLTPENTCWVTLRSTQPTVTCLIFSAIAFSFVPFVSLWFFYLASLLSNAL